MATKRLRRTRNQTRKRKHEKKGGSIQCVYDKPSRKLHITITRSMLDGNLSAIRTACETAIKESSPEKAVKTSSPKMALKKAPSVKAVKTSSPKMALKKASAEASSPVYVHKQQMFHGFPTSESLTSDAGVYDGRREYSE